MTGKNIFRAARPNVTLVGAAIVLCVGLGMSSCATYATRNGVVTPFGTLTSAGVDPRPAIAEYKIYLGAFTSGYDNFLAATKGKDIDISVSHNVFVFTVRAVAK